MSEEFELKRAHKIEEWIMNRIDETVMENVLDFFKVEDIGELTQEQIGAVETYRDEHMDSSILNSGFSWVIWQWECRQEESEA